MKTNVLGAGLGWVLAMTTVAGAQSPPREPGKEPLEAELRNPDDVQLPVGSFFIGDTPQVQKPGAFQGTARGRMYATEEGSEFEVPLQAEVGIAPRVQLQAVVPLETQQSPGGVTGGVSNIEVGADYELMTSEERGLTVAAGVDALLPAPTAELADQSYGAQAKLNAFRQFGAIGLNASVGPKLVREQSGGLMARAELGVGATVGQGTVVPLAEVRTELGEERDVEALAGIQLQPVKPLQVGLGVLGGVHDEDVVYGGAAMLTWELGK